MSVLRLVMVAKKEAQSGLIPSRALSTVLLGVAEGAKDIPSLWTTIKKYDPTLAGHFQATRDPKPLLEGYGDGLLVISWEFRCIESFQEFQPVGMEGVAWRHDGRHTIDEDPVPFKISPEWHCIDHYYAI